MLSKWKQVWQMYETLEGQIGIDLKGFYHAIFSFSHSTKSTQSTVYYYICYFRHNGNLIYLEMRVILAAIFLTRKLEAELIQTPPLPV